MGQKLDAEFKKAANSLLITRTLAGLAYGTLTGIFSAAVGFMMPNTMGGVLMLMAPFAPVAGLALGLGIGTEEKAAALHKVLGISREEDSSGPAAPTPPGA